MTTWSRPRIRDHHSGLPFRWNFDGVPVGLIGYRNFDGTPLLLPAAALCEWNRRRSVSSEEGGVVGERVEHGLRGDIGQAHEVACECGWGSTGHADEESALWALDDHIAAVVDASILSEEEESR